MELKVSSKKLGAPTRITTQKNKNEPQGKEGLQTGHRGDRLTLSRQALSILEQRNRENWEQAQRRREQAKGQGKNEEKMLDSLERGLRTMKLCNRIAARIRAGDRVPPEDLRYLMKNDPAGYRLAMAMRKPKEHPKEWESALEDQDRQETQGENTKGATERSGGEISGGAEV